ncbi:MAG: hypothetical protein LBL69_03775 [Zoogloeaceae bacterium]|jgi:Mor family transcriptional regulator|nr:hypothetical protein [Zoogloeaceae bacterium]
MPPLPIQSAAPADFRSRGPELLLDLADQCAASLIELLRIAPSEAESVGREIAGRMASHWGGQNLYFPMGLSYRLSQRDREIFAKFNGRNHAALAQEFGVSVQWIYRIVREMKKQDIAARQGTLNL